MDITFAGAMLLKLATRGSQDQWFPATAPWEHGYCESFNARLRDELLNGEHFYTLDEARVVIEECRREHYSGIRPHGSLGDRLPQTKSLTPDLPNERWFTRLGLEVD